MGQDSLWPSLVCCCIVLLQVRDASASCQRQEGHGLTKLEAFVDHFELDDRRLHRWPAEWLNPVQLSLILGDSPTYCMLQGHTRMHLQTDRLYGQCTQYPPLHMRTVHISHEGNHLTVCSTAILEQHNGRLGDRIVRHARQDSQILACSVLPGRNVESSKEAAPTESAMMAPNAMTAVKCHSLGITSR